MVENRKKERKFRKPEYVTPVKSKYKEKKSEPPKKECFLPENTVQIISHTAHSKVDAIPHFLLL